jgi:hypothetical protein
MEVKNMWQVEAVQDMAMQYYINLPYHNWDGHIVPMRNFALKEARELEAMGVEIDLEVVLDAIHLHDTNFHLDHLAAGYTSKESYSSDIARHVLKIVGRDHHHINKVTEAIMATEAGADRPTNEATLVVASDLHNVPLSFNVCSLNGIRLWLEKAQLEKHHLFDLTEFFKASADFLRTTYFSTPFEYKAKDGSIIERAGFSAQALKNIVKMSRLSVDAARKIPGASILIPALRPE